VIRLSQLTGQRVLAKDTAQMVGSVKRLHLDQASARIVGLELDGVSDRETMVEWPSIVAIGQDAVIIATASDRREPLDANEQAFTSGELDLVGKVVLQDSGDALGKLEDIVFDEKTGRLAEVLVPGHSVPVERVVALGSYALIVPVPPG
jgi:sporulation protein YlmC with PRC-barrel domain